jgi:hypothetical protein
VAKVGKASVVNAGLFSSQTLAKLFCEKVINGGSSLEYLVHLGQCDICRTGSTYVLLPKVAKVSIATVMPRFENIANVNATFVALFSFRMN